MGQCELKRLAVLHSKLRVARNQKKKQTVKPALGGEKRRARFEALNNENQSKKQMEMQAAQIITELVGISPGRINCQRDWPFLLCHTREENLASFPARKLVRAPQCSCNLRAQANAAEGRFKRQPRPRQPPTPTCI